MGEVLKSVVEMDMYTTFWIIGSALVVGSSAYNEDPPVTSPNGPYDVIMRDFWRWRLEDSPEFAVSVGMDRHHRHLDSFSLESFDHRQRRARQFLDQMAGELQVSTVGMTPRDNSNLELLQSDIETFLAGYTWRLHGGLNPVNYLEGAHKDFAYWLDGMVFDDIDSYEDYSVRLTALASQVHEQIALMKEAVRLEITNHRLAMTGVVESLDVLWNEAAEDSPLYSSFEAQIESVAASGSTREKLKRHVAAVIKDHVLPAFKKLQVFLQEEYLPNTRLSPGLHSLPSGAAYYESCLRWYTDSDVTPLEFHEMGKHRMRTILSDVEKVRTEAAYSGSVGDFLKYAHGASKFFYRSKKEILEAYKLIIQTEIPLRLSRVCRYPRLTTVEVAEMTFPGPDAVVMLGDENVGQSSVFFVNVNNLFKRQKWRLLTTALHEYIPGRHFQFIQERNQSIPHFRKFKDYRKLHGIPYHLPIHSLYIEGWALYAESLGFDMGLYTRLYDRLGAHLSELMQMTKMVVDTGIHSLGWTEARGVNFIMTSTGCDHSEAAVAVQEIVTSPGKAVAPPYGLIEIKLLRHRAKRRLGHRFNLSNFHQQLLSLAPMSRRDFRRRMEKWISGGSAVKLSAALAMTHLIVSFISYLIIISS